jgi:hypothetical protein
MSAFMSALTNSGHLGPLWARGGPQDGAQVCDLRSSPGSLAMLAAMRRASSRVRSSATESPAGLFLEVDVGQLLPALSFTMKHAAVSSTVHGGGKRPFGCPEA